MTGVGREHESKYVSVWQVAHLPLLSMISRAA
jgi:hypothetical protein